MRNHNFYLVLLALAMTASSGVAPAHAAITTNGEYVTGSIPIAPTSDVAHGGTSVFTGQGFFGAGTQSIARVDADGSVTTVVTGLNSIGGIAFDAEGDRLLFTDNALDAPGAPTTGDTVYALPAPLVAAASVPASTLEVLPAGSIPFAQAVLPLPGGALLVGDAAGGATGRVVQVAGGVATDLITGMDFTAGVSLTLNGNEILVGDVDSVTFAGSVERFDLSGIPLGSLATGLSGAFDQATDGQGRLLLTGGFTPTFSSSTVVRIDSLGTVTEVASGFGFSSGIDIDKPSGVISVVDFGAAQIDTLTPIDQMTAGGFGKKECQAEFFGQDPDRTPSGKPRKRWTCEDGDPSCDRDYAADGVCTFLVGTCFSVPDPRTPKCTPGAVDAVEVTRKPKIAGSIAFPELQAAASAVLPTTEGTCSGGVELSVPAGKKVRARLTALAAGKRVDRDSLTLKCKAP